MFRLELRRRYAAWTEYICEQNAHACLPRRCLCITPGGTNLGQIMCMLVSPMTFCMFGTVCGCAGSFTSGIAALVEKMRYVLYGKHRPHDHRRVCRCVKDYTGFAPACHLAYIPR